MSSNSGAQTPREVVAQSAVKSANNGNLTFAGDYKLQFSSDCFRIGAPPMFFENTQYQKGHVAGVFAALDEGVLVYDFQDNVDGYVRNKKGNGHVVE